MSSPQETLKQTDKPTTYYVPDSSPWPIMGSIVLFILVIGAGNTIQHHSMSGRNNYELSITNWSH